MPKTNSKDRFELRYRLSVEDFSILIYLSKQTWSKRIYWNLVPAAYWLLTAIFAVPILFYAPIRQAIINGAGFYVPPLIVAALGLSLLAFHRRILIPAVLRDTLAEQGLDKQIHVNVTSAGITCRNTGITSDIPWKAVKRVVDTYGCIILFTSSGNGVVVPRRIFATQKEAELFVSFVNRKAGKRS
jgi:hypothetical protein